MMVIATMLGVILSQLYPCSDSAGDTHPSTIR